MIGPTEESNVLEMPKPEEAEKASQDEEKKLTPEEMENLRKKAEEQIEEARISHLRGVAINPHVIRNDFQQAIVQAIIHKPEKINTLCESYQHWIAIQAQVPDVDYTVIADEVNMLIKRYNLTIAKDSITGTAHFTMSIHTMTTKQKGDLQKLLNAYEFWVAAENLADEYFNRPKTLLQRIWRKVMFFW